jgi:hypothetical protein
VAGTLSVVGATTLSGAVTLSTTLSVVGNTTVGHLSSISNVTIAGTLSVISDLTVQGNLYVSQAFNPANLATGGTLSVAGVTTMVGGMKFFGLSTGHVMQYGFATGGASFAVTFDTPFTTTPFVFLTAIRNDATPAIAYLRTVSAGGFNSSNKNDGGNDVNASIYWLAIGPV